MVAVVIVATPGARKLHFDDVVAGANVSRAACSGGAKLSIALGNAGDDRSAGLGYWGSLQVVNQLAPTDKRGAVMSSYFICCFIGNALPVIGVGVLSSLTNTIVADIVFACMIVAFAAAAVIFGICYRH